MNSLPDAIDVPEGPRDLPDAGPGGPVPPPMGGSPAEGAPAISMVSDAVLPGEAILITGHDLEGASLRLWAGGELREIEPLQADNLRLQAVAPKDVPHSTWLLWPVKGQRAGAPIRVNGATPWWCWPARLRQEETAESAPLKIMGKNLKVGDHTPHLYLAGPKVSAWLKVTKSDPHCIECLLPQNLSPGRYVVRVHNGSGGKYGWGEPLSFEVAEGPVLAELPVFSVDDYQTGTMSTDDTEAVRQAVRSAAAAGGGIVSFGSRAYHLSETIDTPSVPRGIHFRGSGMGSHTALLDKRPVRNKVEDGTVLRWVEGRSFPDSLMKITARYSTVRDLTLYNGAGQNLKEGPSQLSPAMGLASPDNTASDTMAMAGVSPGSGMQQVLRIEAHDVVLERVRVLLEDHRPYDIPPEKRPDASLRYGACHIQAPGEANIQISHCEFHTPSTGILIDDYERRYTDDGFPEPGTDFIRIDHCVFRGHFTGFYKPPADDDRAGWGLLGSRHSAIANLKAKNVIVENNDMAGADRTNGVMINRTMLNYNSTIRNVYVVGNNAHDMGIRSPDGSKYVNQGEQILFHFNYPHAGYFDVEDTESQSVSVRTDHPRGQGALPRLPIPHVDRSASRVLDEIGTRQHWIAFLCRGKGAGQYRVITGQRREGNSAIFQLERPWRVVPDQSSSLVLTAAMRQNIVCANTVDTGQNDPKSNSCGTMLWFCAFENVVASNAYRNLKSGVHIDCFFRGPTGWNLVRDNVCETTEGGNGLGGETMHGYASNYYLYDFDRNPAVVKDHPEACWLSVGNQYRHNKTDDANIGLTIYGNRVDEDNAARAIPRPDTGQMLELVENCEFTRVDTGIDLRPPAAWTLFHGNRVSLRSPDGVPFDDLTQGQNRCLTIDSE